MVNLLAATRSTARVAATSGVVTANRACLRVSPASAVASVPGWGEAFVDGEEVVVGLGLGLGLALRVSASPNPSPSPIPSPNHYPSPSPKPSPRPHQVVVPIGSLLYDQPRHILIVGVGSPNPNPNPNPNRTALTLTQP